MGRRGRLGVSSIQNNSAIPRVCHSPPLVAAAHRDTTVPQMPVEQFVLVSEREGRKLTIWIRY